MSIAQEDLDLALREASTAPALSLVPEVPLDFEFAVQALRPRLTRYATRRLGDRHEAEELVQEALLRAFTHREKLRTEDDLAAWSTVVTGRLVIDRLRVRGRSISVADVPDSDRVGRDTADHVVAREETRLALDVLDAMPARQAALLWAREVEGQSYDELGQRFGMTEPAVRSLLTRARKALRSEYARRGGTAPVAGLAVLAPWLAGMTWAERLRRVATRVGPSSAMGVAATALGCVVLSPFGSWISGTPDVPAGSPAFVTVDGGSTDPDAAPRTPSTGRLQTPVRRAHGTVPAVPAVPGVPAVPTVCVNDTQRGEKQASITGTGPSAGSGRCDRAQSVRASRLAPAPGVVPGTTFLDELELESDRIDCREIPDTPVLRCTPTTNPGDPS